MMGSGQHRIAVSLFRSQTTNNAIVSTNSLYFASNRRNFISIRSSTCIIPSSASSSSPTLSSPSLYRRRFDSNDISALLRNDTSVMSFSSSVSSTANKNGNDPTTKNDGASSIPLTMKDVDNSDLITLAALENVEARAEVLIRHIMSVDNVPHDEATQTFKKIRKSNRKNLYMYTLPHFIGLGGALGGATLSIPLIFHRSSVEWFNDKYVTTDTPPEVDLETLLEVGSWSWNWMEPVLGEVSFLLLCLQFARAQLVNLGLRPYTNYMKGVRANRLASEFPRYNSKVVKDYSKSVDYFG